MWRYARKIECGPRPVIFVVPGAKAKEITESLKFAVAVGEAANEVV